MLAAAVFDTTLTISCQEGTAVWNGMNWTCLPVPWQSSTMTPGQFFFVCDKSYYTGAQIFQNNFVVYKYNSSNQISYYYPTAQYTGCLPIYMYTTDTNVYVVWNWYEFFFV